MMSSECKEMTQELGVIELSVFKEEISSSSIWPLLQTKKSGFCLHELQVEEKIPFYGMKQMAGVVFLSENQCRILLQSQENGEGVGERILFSSQIS